jgi:hypothetical protein
VLNSISTYYIYYALPKKKFIKNPNINKLLEMVGPVKNDYEEGKIIILKKKEKVI